MEGGEGRERETEREERQRERKRERQREVKAKHSLMFLLGHVFRVNSGPMNDIAAR